MATEGQREGALTSTRRTARNWWRKMKQKAVCCGWCAINTASWRSFHAHWSRSLFKNCCSLGPDRIWVILNPQRSFPPRNHLVSHPLLYLPKDTSTSNRCFSTVILQPRWNEECVDVRRWATHSNQNQKGTQEEYRVMSLKIVLKASLSGPDRVERCSSKREFAN